MTDNLDLVRLGAPVRHTQRHLLVGVGVDRVRSEAELGAEDGLALQSRALPDEKVVEVGLQRLLVHVEYLVAEMERVRTVRPEPKLIKN